MNKDRKVIQFPAPVTEDELLAEIKQIYEQAALARSSEWANYIQEIASDGTWEHKDAILFRDLFIDWAVFFETDENGMTPHGNYLKRHKSDLSPTMLQALRGLAIPRCSIFTLTETGTLRDWETDEQYTVPIPPSHRAGDLFLGKLIDTKGTFRFASAFLALPSQLHDHVSDLYVDFVGEVGPRAFLDQFPEFCAELIDLLLDLTEGDS